MSSSASVALNARQISVELGDKSVLVDVDLTITERARLAIVGANGVGKSTLLRVLAGELRPGKGSVETAPAAATVGLVRQELDRSATETGRQFLARRLNIADAQDRFDAATEAVARGDDRSADRFDRALVRWLALGVPDFAARTEQVAADLGLAPELLDLPTANLSGGEASRLGLAVVLLSRFDITLLDEPTNDLDLAGLHRLERWVGAHDGGIVLVSHDRSFLQRTVTSVLEIDEHAHTARLFNGGWEAFRDEKATARRHAEQEHASYEREQGRLASRAQQQREWAQQGLSRVKKDTSEKDKNIRAFKVAQTEKLAGKAKATERAMSRLERVEKPWEGWDLRFSIAAAERSATVVAALAGAVIGRGGFRLGPIDQEIRWAERVAIVGPNGSGKSTLIDTLLGRLRPLAGIVELGPRVIVGELSQSRHQFERSDGASLLEVFQDESGLLVSETRAVLAKFGLGAEAVERPANSLSPGERTRSHLALFQARGVNLLILDEPTNHLDLPAIEQLESALATYEGTLLLVSHDRTFLEKVAIHRTIDITHLPIRRTDS